METDRQMEDNPRIILNNPSNKANFQISKRNKEIFLGDLKDSLECFHRANFLQTSCKWDNLWETFLINE